MRRKLQTINRIVRPVINLRAIYNCIKNIINYIYFFNDYRKYKSISNEVIEFGDIWPELNDKTSLSQSGGGQYFYQDNWALKQIYESNVKEHFDIGSRIDGFTSQCSIFTKVNFIDFRYIDYNIENMKCIQGDILKLPFNDRSISSLSCLHVVEHIGLGRYGDTMNPNGSKEALRELQRVLSVGGNLYLGIPIGRERVMFHAHRVLSPNTIIEELNELELIEFCAVDDQGVFVKNASLCDYYESFYSLGLFKFNRRS